MFLEPSLPLFKYEDVGERLAATDANYVEIMITNADMLGFHPVINPELSGIAPLGHAIFYPNPNGQTGCGSLDFGTCAHCRAYEYYLESINSPQHSLNHHEFFGFKCDSYEHVLDHNINHAAVPVKMGGEPGNQKYNYTL